MHWDPSYSRIHAGIYHGIYREHPEVEPKTALSTWTLETTSGCSQSLTVIGNRAPDVVWLVEPSQVCPSMKVVQTIQYILYVA